MTTEIENLRAKKQEILDAIELQRLRQQVGILDSARRTVVREAWGDLVDRSEYLRDTPGWGRMSQLDARISTASDRLGGKNAPFVESEADLSIMRGLGRYVSTMSEPAIGVVENLINYTIGTGYTYEATERAETREPIPEGLVSAVQYLVDEFTEENNFIGDLDAEIYRDSIIDGDVGVRIHAKGGKGIVRLVTAEYITEPADKGGLSEYAGAYDLDWSFGVGTEPGDVQTVYGYNVQWDAGGADWEYVPASEMVFIRRNVPRNVKRGISDFFPVGKRLELADKVLTNVGVGTAIQAAIAYVVEHSPQMSQSQIETLVGNAIDYSYTENRGNQGSKTVSERYFAPGTIVDTNNRKYQPSPLATAGNAVFLPVFQALLRSIGVRWNMPEYMISGDASNANYASTMVAESPFIRSIVRAQAKYGKHFVEIIWKGLKVAIDAGRLPGIETVGQLKRMITITATAPDATVRDVEQQARVNQIEQAAGVLSRRTWANESGRDYDVEQENMRDEPPVGQAAYPQPAGAIRESYDPSQARADDGKWTDGGGSSGGISSSGGEATTSSGETPPDGRKIINAWVRGTSGSEFADVKSEGVGWVKGEKSERFEELYGDTQAKLRNDGVTSIKAYRGITVEPNNPLARAIASGKVKIGDTIDVEGMPLVSYSENETVAQRFASVPSESKTDGIVLERVIDASDVVTSHRTQDGFLHNEFEVVARNKNEAKLRVRAAIIGGKVFR